MLEAYETLRKHLFFHIKDTVSAGHYRLLVSLNACNAQCFSRTSLFLKFGEMWLMSGLNNGMYEQH